MNLKAKSPPGWEHTVEHMKDHPEIDNPFALAWYMHDEGDTPHIKSTSAGTCAACGDAHQRFKASSKFANYRARHAMDARASQHVSGLTMQAARMIIAGDDGRGAVRFHPNALPFKAILHQVDEASTRPPSGAQGHCVLVPREVVLRRGNSLLGMGINITTNMGGHDVRRKVGVISAWDLGKDPAPEIPLRLPIRPQDVVIAGHLYARDFPDEISEIRAQAQSGIGGSSYEVADVDVEDINAKVWKLTDLTYTGAAILRRAAAAYNDSRIAATRDDGSAAGGDTMELTAAQLEVIANKVAERLFAQIGTVSPEDIKKVRELEASAEEQEDLARACRSAARRIRAEHDEPDGDECPEEEKKAADAKDMEARAALNKARDLRAQARVLAVPAFLRPVVQAAAELVTDEGQATRQLITDTVATSMRSLATDTGAARAPGQGKQVQAEKGTKSDEPTGERRTIAAATVRHAIMAGKFDEIDVGTRPLNETQVDELLAGLNLTSEQRISKKLELQKAGKML